MIIFFILFADTLQCVEFLVVLFWFVRVRMACVKSSSIHWHLRQVLSLRSKHLRILLYVRMG